MSDKVVLDRDIQLKCIVLGNNVTLALYQYANQYGFRHKLSTLHAVTKLVTDIVKNNDNKESTLSIFIDLSKAFDTIDHDILLAKLEFYGIRGIALDWFKSYFFNRKQYVSYNGSQSYQLNSKHGVPQGSVLGPIVIHNLY